MRLDKFIVKSTEQGLSEALSLIKNKRVVINDIISIDESQQVHRNNVVTLNGKVLRLMPFRYFVLNKPPDMICSNVDEAYPSVLNLLDVDRVNELHIAGRLDVNTTGLVLITDDGHWSFNLTLPTNHCEKVYRVVLSRPISPEAVQSFKKGFLLQGESKPTLPATLNIIDRYNVILTITEGRFHQVKRMFSATGNRVQSLHRQKIGKLALDVDMGQWRSLTETEVEGLAIKT